MILTPSEKTSLRRVLGMAQINRKRFALSVMWGTLGLGSSIALAAVSAWLIARASQMPPVLELSVAATSVRAFGIGKALFRYIERISSHQVALAGMTDLRTGLYSTLADSRTDKVASLRRGDVLTRTGADVDRVGDVVVKALLPATVALTTGVLTLIILGALSPAIAVAVGLCLIASATLGPIFAGRGARAAEEALTRDQAELAALSLAILDGADELRVGGTLGAMLEKQKSLEKQIQAHRDRAARPAAGAMVVDILALGAAVIAALAIGIPQVEAGTLSGVALAVCVLTPLAAFEGTAVLGGAAVTLVRGAASAERIDQLLDGTQAEERTTDRPEAVVEARDLVVGWPGGPELTEPLSFTVRPGQSLAILGPSGAGKSTLLATLAGLIEPKSGQALIGTLPASSLTPASVSSVMTLTAEDSHIFHTSVLENLRVARADLGPEEAREALVAVGLGEWLDGLEDGLDHVIGSDGLTVSGGERRRLLVARALASKAPILALDEPVEHLDAGTSDDLIASLLASDLGVIVVTHRLSGLRGADEIIVLSGPRGSFDEVMADPHMKWALDQENL